MPSEHRLHLASVLFSLAGSLKAFLLPAVLLFFSTGRSTEPSSGPRWMNPSRWMDRWIPGDLEIASWQFWLLLLLIPATIVAVIRYLTFRLCYEGSELVIRSGLVFRNERHVPYDRIQNLDAVRNVVHRVLGVVEVRIETGGGQTPEATISVLHETVFEEMRRRIFAGRVRTAPAAPDLPETIDRAAAQAVDTRTLLHLPLRELLLNGVLENRGLILVAGAYGVLWEAGLVNIFWDQLAIRYGQGLVRETIAGLARGELPSPIRIAMIVVGVAGLLVLVRLLSLIWSFVRLHEFRLSRVGDELRTEYGLLTRVTATIPLWRIQTLTIRESPLQRLVERMTVRVDTAGGPGARAEPGEQARRQREPLAPIIRRAAVPALVREVLPTTDLNALEWQSLHPRAFRRALKPALLLAVVTSAPFLGWFGWGGIAILPVVSAFLAIVTMQQVQHMHWAATEDVVAFRSGWLWRNVTIAPIAKIQAVSCTESPFDRRAAMASLRVDTAGGRMHRISIPYLGRETAERLFGTLATRAAQTAFHW